MINTHSVMWLIFFTREYPSPFPHVESKGEPLINVDGFSMGVSMLVRLKNESRRHASLNLPSAWSPGYLDLSGLFQTHYDETCSHFYAPDDKGMISSSFVTNTSMCQ